MRVPLRRLCVLDKCGKLEDDRDHNSDAGAVRQAFYIINYKVIILLLIM